jgi:hypothetical protein
MPVMRDYACQECKFIFETMCSKPACKKCGSSDVKTMLSAPAGSGNFAHGMLRGTGKVDTRAAFT